jgi:hypothetical protein
MRLLLRAFQAIALLSLLSGVLMAFVAMALGSIRVMAFAAGLSRVASMTSTTPFETSTSALLVALVLCTAGVALLALVRIAGKRDLLPPAS